MVNSITKCFIGLILLAGQGCKQGAKQNTSKKADSLVATSVGTSNNEYLPWDSVKLNGTIPVISILKNTEEKLGKADSIITPKYDDISASFFNNERYKYYYFKGAEFEGSSDSLVLRTIDFKKDTGSYLVSNHLRFNHLTTIAEFNKIFPNSAAHELSGADMDKYRVISLAMSKKETEDKWLFFFNSDGNKLLRIDYWIPD
jgi:hypothetical protein